MLAPQQMVMIIFGVIICFAGYSLFRNSLPVWGFILGGWLAYNFAPVLIPEAQADSLVFLAIVIVGGGLIGGLLARPLYMFTIFMTGALLGGVLGVFAGALLNVGGLNSVGQVQRLIDMAFPPIPQTGTQFLLMFIFGLIAGGLAVMFVRNMLIASTAFLGAALLVTGLATYIGGIAGSAPGRALAMAVAWLAFGLFGMFAQSRLMSD